MKKLVTRADIAALVKKLGARSYLIELSDWDEDVMSISVVASGKTLATGVGKTPQDAASKLEANLHLALGVHEDERREEELRRWRDRQPDVR
jgi:hypothetical protein